MNSNSVSFNNQNNKNQPKPFINRYNNNRSNSNDPNKTNTNGSKFSNYNNSNNTNNYKNFNKPQDNRRPFGKKPQVTEIEIHPLQEKNPIWSILQIPFKKNENLTADFLIPDSYISLVFLSLQFHQNYPLYIEDKLDKLIKSEDAHKCPNKMLLCLFDVEDTNNHLMDLTILCIEKNVKLLLGFSFSEIANYIASFKYIEKTKNAWKKDLYKPT